MAASSTRLIEFMAQSTGPQETNQASVPTDAAMLAEWGVDLVLSVNRVNANLPMLLNSSPEEPAASLTQNILSPNGAPNHVSLSSLRRDINDPNFLSLRLNPRSGA